MDQGIYERWNRNDRTCGACTIREEGEEKCQRRIKCQNSEREEEEFSMSSYIAPNVHDKTNERRKLASQK